MKIYKRIYDNPINPDGTKKPNVFIGEFKIVQTLFIDGYSSQRLGVKNGEYYLIEEKEVSYKDGGSRFSVTKLNINK